ncbi:putative DNA polymerase subunit delta-3 [Cercophora samala]|uniref:DNA polymerase delta subunit 3 n=1 Tax=Cercophora samala TaxID=330535 RepID=A0AA39ZL14_9PEZI|nr:putative DNA polymerase subunit delta-3 [Cercophora samala]
MNTYLKYLSETVLAEEKVVDYVLLSQSLQVPVNTAKQMLYEFHRTQNAKRPGSVHATYLIYGVKYNNNSQNGDDEDMPDADSVTDAVPVYHLHLVTEEKLRDVLAEYEEVTTIHVYSVSPQPIKDMALLADLAQDVRKSDKKVPVSITNPNVRTRERKGLGPKTATAATAAVKQQPKSAPKVKEEEPKPVEEPKPAVKTEKPTKATTSAPAKKPAPAKSSGIMAAFSKAASLPKKEKPSKPASPAVTETNTPALSDEDDDEEEMPQPKARAKPGFKTKKQREEDLRRMMEEEDDEEEAPASERAESPEEPEPEPMEVEEEAPEPVKEEKEVVETTSNGRRRGKRRVMRKKQIMDEQGYLVTIQEPGWESFSEDEAPPPAKVVKTTSSASSTQGSKAKKPAAKGQGSIMSFFSKKA